MIFLKKFISLISAFQRTRSLLNRVNIERKAAHKVPESLIFAVIKVFTTRASCINPLGLGVFLLGSSLFRITSSHYFPQNGG